MHVLYYSGNFSVSLKLLPNKKFGEGLPWRSSGWDFVFQCSGCGLIPGQGAKISHAAEQMSPCATTTEPAL